jgi:transmembrane sensor
MNTSDEQVREIIAQQAGEWFVAHRAGSLDATERRAFDAWLTASPVHVEEYLGVALLSRHLPAAADDPEMPLETILERARETEAERESALKPPSRISEPTEEHARPSHTWRWVTAIASVVVVIGITLLWWSSGHVATERYATRHGEMKTWRLTDNSILHLNTDTALTVRYSHTERLVDIDHGEAFFEVPHEPTRPFRVIAGTANVVAVGTSFDVYREAHSTRVTVTEGRVAVGARDLGSTPLSVSAGEQVQVSPGSPPTHATPADFSRTTAWLRRQIAFDDEPLEAVAAEFNRYSKVPMEITTPELRTLSITGTFSVDDTESFVAFLRAMEGVRVEVTTTRIRVSKRDTNDFK